MTKIVKLIHQYTLWFFLGCVSGIPLALSGGTLSLFLADLGITKSSIGIFTLIATVYTFKFLYAPFIDGFKIPLLSKAFGQRRDWMILSYFCCATLIILAGIFGEKDNITIFAVLTFFIALFSSIFDIAVDGFRITAFERSEYGIVSSVFIYGYRIGMLISGAFALYFAHIWDWKITYCIIGAIYVIIGAISISVSQRFKVSHIINADNTCIYTKLEEIFFRPWKDIISRQYGLVFILMISMFKLSDACIGSMLNIFFQEIGFSKIEIANISKVLGLFATLIGIGIGGYMTKTISTSKLIIFALVLQILSNQIFILNTYFGHNLAVLASTICCENVCSGISSAVLVFVISCACNIKYSATHYAIFSAAASFGRTFLSSFSGIVVDKMGWIKFFMFCGVIEIPCILIALFLLHKKTISLSKII